MIAERTPLVTVAIPLHRSRSFVDTIVRNVENIGLPDVEILISDRHQDDDALEVLAARLARDHRVRLFGARDRIGWVDHYNALLRAARGRYFTWMPHDDDCPPGYVSGLMSALEERSDVILAFGRVHVLGQQGETLFADDRSPLTDDDDLWTPRAALEMLMFRGQWLPQFHGVFRREPVVRAGLLIRPTSGNVEADLYWVFGVGLLGEVRQVVGCSYVKHLHGTNASITWGARRMRHVVDGFVVPWGYLRGTAAPSVGDTVRAVLTLTIWAILRAVACLTQNSRRPSPQTRERIRRLSRRLLFRT